MDSRPLKYIEVNEKADKATRGAKILPLMSPDDKLRKDDKYCMQLSNSEWHQITENKLREIKHSVALWPKFNQLS